MSIEMIQAVLAKHDHGDVTTSAREAFANLTARMTQRVSEAQTQQELDFAALSVDHMYGAIADKRRNLRDSGAPQQYRAEVIVPFCNNATVAGTVLAERLNGRYWFHPDGTTQAFGYWVDAQHVTLGGAHGAMEKGAGDPTEISISD